MILKGGFMKKLLFLSIFIVGCYNQQVTQLVQGPKGDKGDKGADGASVIGPAGPPGVTVVNPCDTKSLLEEVLLVTPQGVIGMYDNPDTGQAYLTVLPPGEHKTRDTTDCVFTVEPDITVSW